MSRRVRRLRTISAGAIVASVAAVASLASTSIDPPAPPGSSYPTLAAESVATLRQEHDVLMTWLEPSGSGNQLKFARLVEHAWSPPVTIAKNVSALDPTDRPALTVLDTQAVRRTLIARTGDVVARSGDAGRTWARLPAPALPFASFAGGDEGGYAFWLGDNGDSSAKLLGTRILAGETLLDPSAWSNSGTSAAMTWDGPVVAYRDHGAEGAQDIAMVRRQDARWTRPRPVHHVAGWRPTQEPKSGPEVAAQRRQVAVAWYTEAPHRPRVLVAFSGDAGRSFGPPVEVDVKKGVHAPLDFVDVALDDDGHALVLWMAATRPLGATLELARVAADGRRGEALVLAKELSAHLEGIPQMTRAGDHVAVTWVAGGRVRAVTAALAGIPEPGSSTPGPAVAAGEASKTPPARDRLAAGVSDLELMALGGDQVSLASLRGRAVLLNLWATWCIPCIAEMPELAALHERYVSKGLVVVGLNVDDATAADKVRAFVAERKMPFPVWLDPEMRVYSALRVKSLPVTLLVDREGGVVLRRDGTITADDPELEETIRSTLSDP